MISNGIRKTRGAPSQGSTNYTARKDKWNNAYGQYGEHRGYLNASGFFGTGVSTLQVMWWSLGAVIVLAVVSKGVKTYREIKR